MLTKLTPHLNRTINTLYINNPIIKNSRLYNTNLFLTNNSIRYNYIRPKKNYTNKLFKIQ